MVGQRIRERRKELKMRQDELAEKTGISRVTISRIETGDDLNMTTFTAVRIAEVLGISLDYLLCGKC